MAKNSIELQIGLPTEPQTSFSLQIERNQAKNVEKNKIKFFFPCREKSFARSLQVLLSPYFGNWNPVLEVVGENVEISISVDESVFRSELFFEVKLGMKVDGLKANFLQELFESLSLKLNCQDIQEFCHFLGLSDLKVINTDIYLSIDPDDLPPEFLQFYQKELENYCKYLEVLDAIRPLLSTTQIRVLGSIGNLIVNGEIKYYISHILQKTGLFKSIHFLPSTYLSKEPLTQQPQANPKFKI